MGSRPQQQVDQSQQAVALVENLALDSLQRDAERELRKSLLTA